MSDCIVHRVGKKLPCFNKFDPVSLLKFVICRQFNTSHLSLQPGKTQTRPAQLQTLARVLKFWL